MHLLFMWPPKVIYIHHLYKVTLYISHTWKCVLYLRMMDLHSRDNFRMERYNKI